MKDNEAINKLSNVINCSFSMLCGSKNNNLFYDTTRFHSMSDKQFFEFITNNKLLQLGSVKEIEGYCQELIKRICKKMHLPPVKSHVGNIDAFSSYGINTNIVLISGSLIQTYLYRKDDVFPVKLLFAILHEMQHYKQKIETVDYLVGIKKTKDLSISQKYAILGAMYSIIDDAIKVIVANSANGELAQIKKFRQGLSMVSYFSNPIEILANCEAFCDAYKLKEEGLLSDIDVEKMFNFSPMYGGININIFDKTFISNIDSHINTLRLYFNQILSGVTYPKQIDEIYSSCDIIDLLKWQGRKYEAVLNIIKGKNDCNQNDNTNSNQTKEEIKNENM